jgi:DNA/RNA endonuclease G (NUC1)
MAGNKGTVKNEGKIVIPAFTWKVAVIMPRNQGLANIDDVGDLEVIAAIMPNEPGRAQRQLGDVQDDPWMPSRR